MARSREEMLDELLWRLMPELVKYFRTRKDCAACRKRLQIQDNGTASERSVVDKIDEASRLIRESSKKIDEHDKKNKDERFVVE